MGRPRLWSAAPSSGRDEPPERRPGPLPPPSDAPSGVPPGEAALQCRRCQKPITDLELEIYFPQTGLCFWCAHVDSQG